MRALDRKLSRDLWQMRAQALAIGLVLASAVTILVGAMGTYRALIRSRDDYYVSGGFGDLFVQLNRAPWNVVEQIRAIPGTIDAEARIVEPTVPLHISNAPNQKLARSKIQPSPPKRAAVGTPTGKFQSERSGDRRWDADQKLAQSKSDTTPTGKFQSERSGDRRWDAEQKSATLVSLPADKGPRLNRLQLQSGRMPAPYSRREAVVHQAFAEANDLEPGAEITLVIKGRPALFRIAGVALAPEFIYAVRPGEMMPDNKSFGIVWIRQNALAEMLDMNRTFNDLVVRMAPDASERAVVDQMDRALAPYGGLGAFTRENHVSHRFLADDIEQLRLIAILLPLIFFGVAAYLLHMVVSRLVSVQREQIAALKALGYKSVEIAVHFIKMVTVIVVFSVAVGALGGSIMSDALSSFFATDLYRLPRPISDYQVNVLLIAAFTSLITSYAATWNAMRRAANLPPAQAMRPKPPDSYRPTIIERIGLVSLFSQTGRIVLRGISRRPWKTILASLGIAFAVSILVAAGYLADAIETVVNVSFRQAQRQDLTVTYTVPQSRSALLSLGSMPGVLAVEPFRAIPVILANGQRAKRLPLTGLEPAGRLRRVTDENGKPVPLPESGVVLTAEAGRILDVRTGDDVRITFLEGKRLTATVRVTGLADELLGLNAYMGRARLNMLLREDDRASGVYMKIAPSAEESLTDQLRRTPAVAGVSSQEKILTSFERFTATVILAFTGILTVFAIIIVVAVVYNSARILVAERQNELTTLRVLGMTRSEISRIFFGELAVQVALALPFGMLAGYGFSIVICRAMTSDLIRLPLVLEPSTYGFAAAVCLAASLAVILLVRRQIDRLDLISVLKVKE